MSLAASVAQGFSPVVAQGFSPVYVGTRGHRIKIVSCLPVMLAAFVLAAPGCAARRPPVAKTGSSVAVQLAPLPTLKAELEQIFGAPAFARATWGVLIQSLDTGETIFALNANKFVMPASNMKIVTLAAAAERLGWDYRFTTDLVALGDVDAAGVLHGDLVVVGHGDPSINGRGGASATQVFDRWTARLRELGITEIDGRIIGDDDAFDEEGLGSGWSWDYLGYGYAAPVGALEFNENVVQVTLRPGTEPGDAVAAEVKPAEGVEVVNRLTTGTPGSSADIELRRLPGRNALELYGTVPAKLGALTRNASVDNPTLFFVRALRAAMVAGGIAVGGEAVDVDELHASIDRSRARTLLTHQSPTLAEIARVLMKVSQNLYAETLLKTLGTLAPPIMTTAGPRPGAAAAGGDGPQPVSLVRGTAEGGRRVVRDVLASWGIPPDSLIMYDGSGLARGNAVTPELLVRLLRHMYITPRHASPFVDSLPIGGVDGTLEDRFRGTRAEANVRAKTGSIANVRALSGYVRTEDDELLAFSIIANTFNMPQSSVDAVTDRVVDRLARFKRR